MAAVTAVVAVAGLAITAGQMIDQNNKAKAAKSQLESDKAALANIKEVNPYEGLQAPDISSLANQEIARSTKEGVTAAQDIGEAGAAQITNMVQGGRNAALDVAQSQAQANFNTDVTIASGEADIQQRNVMAQRAALNLSMNQSQGEMENAQANVNAGVGDLFAGASVIAGEAGKASSLDKKAQRTSKNKSKGINSNINAENYLGNLSEEQMAALSVGSNSNPL